MAKQPVTQNSIAFGVGSLTTEQRRAVAALKPQITKAAADFGAVREKLQDLAPRTVKLFNSIAAEQEAFTFVDFCRLFDPTVPTHAADRDGEIGYRNHRTYYTLDYMRRIVRQAGRPRGQQGVRSSATDLLARILRTIINAVEDPERVYAAVQTEFDFKERLMTRLRKRVEETEPLIKLTSTKPIKIGNVVHMEKPAVAPAAAGEALTQPGRRVNMGSGKRKTAAA